MNSVRYSIRQVIILAQPHRHQSKVSSEQKGERGRLWTFFLSIILSFNKSRQTCVERDAYANEKLLFSSTQSLPSLLTINHFHIHYFSPLGNIIVFKASCHHFPTITKTISTPLSSAQTYFLPLWHLLLESELCVCFSLGPDFEPVGWSLITMEWAPNGCLHRSPTPTPTPHSAPCPGSPWRPVAEWLGPFY